MNKITRNLWIGDLPSALNIQRLRENNIHSILSVMRGKLKINQTFIHHQIELDDTHEADILSRLLPAVRLIGGELEKGRGVLVHCLAGISRSPTIVAAYLIYTLNITPDEALGIILKQRPFVQPNTSFLRQLDLFHYSQGNISSNDKDIRRFYLERTVHEVMSGDGLATEMLSGFPNPPSSLGPDTRSTSMMTTTTTTTMPTSHRQRRIRCKMCRQDLATREHMLDHGQLRSPADQPSGGRPQTNSYPSEALDHETTSQKIESASDRNGKSVSTTAAVDANNIENTAKVASLSDTTGSGSELVTNSDSIDQPSPTTTSLKDPPDLSPELQVNRRPSESSQQDLPQHDKANLAHISPLTLVNPTCSGYFVEPMKWMDHFLSAGSLAGKITCPNKKCNAKLGNYDWAGVCCGCKIWVTPGFCINRSKVDEVV